MAVSARSGGSGQGSGLAFGMQSDINTAVTDILKMIPLWFKTISLDVNRQTDELVDDEIGSFGPGQPNEHGQFWSTFASTFALKAHQLPYFLLGVLNPTITKTTLANEVAQAAATTANSMAITTTPKPAWASKLKITGAGATFGSNAKAIVEGFVKSGYTDTKRREQYREVEIPLTTADSGGTSDVLFQEVVTDVNAITLSGVTGGTIKFDWIPDTHKTNLVIQPSDPQFEGWTVQGSEGGSPFVAQSVVPGDMSITQNSSGIVLAINALGSHLARTSTISRGFRPAYRLSSAEETRYVRGNYKRAQTFASVMTFGSIKVKFTEITIEFNRNYENEEGFDGELWKVGVTPSANRQLLISTSQQFKTSDGGADGNTKGSDQYFDVNEAYDRGDEEAIAIKNRVYHGNGRVEGIDLNFPVAKVNTPPQRSVSGSGAIIETYPFQAFTDATHTSEISVDIYSENEYVPPPTP